MSILNSVLGENFEKLSYLKNTNCVPQNNKEIELLSLNKHKYLEKRTSAQ
jgi:hypothetical protein